MMLMNANRIDYYRNSIDQKQAMVVKNHEKYLIVQDWMENIGV